MDKPSAQSKRARPGRARARVPAGRIDGAKTRSLILEAARRRLVAQGYANLNVRDIARDAGVNHALIGYHFHGKQQLVLAVLDEANARLLERQARMFGDAAATADKWQQACDFYEEDLRSGFVKLLMELMGASFHDEALRREFNPRLLEWRKLIEGAANEFLARTGLQLPMSSCAIASGISWLWLGIEASMALRIPEREGHQQEVLEVIGKLLRGLESRPRAASSRRKR